MMTLAMDEKDWYVERVSYPTVNPTSNSDMPPSPGRTCNCQWRVFFSSLKFPRSSRNLTIRLVPLWTFVKEAMQTHLQ
jgi:hypothetical protein